MATALPAASAELVAARAVLAAWSLSPPLALGAVTGGATHHVYRVECPEGVFFLRRYERPDPALARREHAVIEHVARAGLPAPRALAARAGSSVVTRDGAVFALYDAASGTQLPRAELGERQAAAAGEFLARLHRALAPLPDVGYVRWSLSWDARAWCERLGVVERVPLLARPELDETDRWALERVRKQREWLADPRCAHQCTPVFAPQLTHGDYQDANLFFDAHGVSGVIDWDQAAFMPRAYELARACGFMFRLEPELTALFVAAYRSVSPLGTDELWDGVRAWAAFSDHHVWPVEEVYLHGNDAARRYIPHAPFRPFAEAWPLAD